MANNLYCLLLMMMEPEWKRIENSDVSTCNTEYIIIIIVIQLSI